MEIKLKKLWFSYFKGIKQLEISLSDITNVFGKNESGKTTIVDGWNFLLFGKDSHDKKDFEIKPLSLAGIPLQKTENEVGGHIEINGTSLILKRIMREKWVKKRGEPEASFAGNENLFFWNDVPLKLEEYQAKINALLNEGIFKLITNPLYFNSFLKWQERRGVLISIAGNISDSEVFDSLISVHSKYDYTALINTLNSGKSLEEYRTQISARKKKLKDELVLIPARIDELNRSLPDEIDFDSLAESITAKQEEISTVEELINNSSKAFTEKKKEQKKVEEQYFQLMYEGNDIKNKLQGDIQKQDRDSKRVVEDLKERIMYTQKSITQKNIELDTAEKKIQKYKTERESLRERWNAINSSELVFEEGAFICPSCKRALEDSEIAKKQEELTKNHNEYKVSKCAAINSEGKEVKARQEQVEAMINNIQGELNLLSIELLDPVAKLKKHDGEMVPAASVQERVELQLSMNTEYQEIQKHLEELQTKITETPQSDIGELQKRKIALGVELDTLKNQFNQKIQIEKTQARISELEKQERDLAQQVADAEKTEFLIEKFSKTKIDMLESRINKRFRYVRFKMFDTQINGAVVETCDATYKGVPFSDLNNAAKFLVGIDIINTLSKHYNVYAPVFLDNRESVSEIPETTSQIINLIVSPGDSKLRIEHEVKEPSREKLSAVNNL